VAVTARLTGTLVLLTVRMSQSLARENVPVHQPKESMIQLQLQLHANVPEEECNSKFVVRTGKHTGMNVLPDVQVQRWSVKEDVRVNQALESLILLQQPANAPEEE